MIAAIYARESTDRNIADEEKSVTRQWSARQRRVRHATPPASRPPEEVK